MVFALDAYLVKFSLKDEKTGKFIAENLEMQVYSNGVRGTNSVVDMYLMFNKMPVKNLRNGTSIRLEFGETTKLEDQENKFYSESKARKGVEWTCEYFHLNADTYALEKDMDGKEATVENKGSRIYSDVLSKMKYGSNGIKYLTDKKVLLLPKAIYREK